MIRYNTAKAVSVLKMVPNGAESAAEGDIMYLKTMEETAKDILADFSRRGW